MNRGQNSVGVAILTIDRCFGSCVCVGSTPYTLSGILKQLLGPMSPLSTVDFKENCVK